jgi:formylglycine-generating enzyme required for sulfatase activity
MSFARRSGPAALALLLAATAPALPQDSAPTWPKGAWNNQPADDDIVLPMPCGGAMAFRRVEVPSSGELDDYKITVGGRDEARAPIENARVAYLSAPFAEQGARAYYLGKYEVSEQQYAALEEECPEPAEDGFLPKTKITWAEAALFAERYSDWLLQNARDRLPAQDGAPGFLRLPTETEWEFAARGGTAVSPSEFEARLFPMAEEPARYLWYDGVDSSNRELNVIGLLKPNPLGLHDMPGNVAELTLEPFRLDRVGRPHGRAGGFVKRGGDYRTPLSAIHSGLREEFAPLDKRGARRESATGFRLALVAPALTDLGQLAQIRKDWAELAAAEKEEDSLGRDQADPVAEAKVLADGTSSPEMKRRLLNLAQVIAANIATRNEQRGRAAREMLRAAVLAGRRLTDFFPRLARCERLMQLSKESQERNRAACGATAANFAFDTDHYVDFATRIGGEFPFTLLTEQAIILRTEFAAQKLDAAVTSVSQVLDDIELLRTGGPEMKPAIIDGWRRSQR